MLEPVLAGTAAAGATPADIVAAAAAARVAPQCNDPATGLDAEVGLGDPGRNVKYTGFGATAEAATATENSEQGCPTRYALDDSKMDCSGDTCLAVRRDRTQLFPHWTALLHTATCTGGVDDDLIDIFQYCSWRRLYPPA